MATSRYLTAELDFARLSPFENAVDVEGAPGADPRPDFVLGGHDGQEPAVDRGAELPQQGVDR
jgi:hypothetical protein